MQVQFQSPRLDVYKASKNISSENLNKTLEEIIKILSPKVVENLPVYFHNIKTKEDAKIYLYKMLDESHLFFIKQSNKNDIIGLLFVYEENEKEAHIGYLLGENYWGKGFASELLTCFIEFSKKETKWQYLFGGVDKTNEASAYLLKKLGFTLTSSSSKAVEFYKYTLRA